MRSTFVLTAMLLGGAASATAAAQTWHPPADSQRCPSKWGAADQRGAGAELLVALGVLDRDGGALQHLLRRGCLREFLSH